MGAVRILEKGQIDVKILAVDTSASVAAVAINDNGRLLGEYIINHKKTHSQKLMPMIEHLLGELELKAADMDAFAASSGPGSFTGLRIGITTVKAMAYATGKPVISVPTLDALALNIPAQDMLICPIMDARNNQVFTAVYRWEKGLPVKLTEYLGVHISELVELLKEKDMRVCFNGDGVGLHAPYLEQELGGRCLFAPETHMLQRASSVAQLAQFKAAAGELESCFEMVPFYLRKSQAEREFEKRNSASLGI